MNASPVLLGSIDLRAAINALLHPSPLRRPELVWVAPGVWLRRRTPC